MRAEGRWMSGELSKRDKDTDKQERRDRIRESREDESVTKEIPGRVREREK
jgi:hypothetical protein